MLSVGRCTVCTAREISAESVNKPTLTIELDGLTLYRYYLDGILNWLSIKISGTHVDCNRG
jgi:hypothetical protein